MDNETIRGVAEKVLGLSSFSEEIWPILENFTRFFLQLTESLRSGKISRGEFERRLRDRAVYVSNLLFQMGGGEGLDPDLQKRQAQYGAAARRLALQIVRGEFGFKPKMILNLTYEEIVRRGLGAFIIGAIVFGGKEENIDVDPSMFDVLGQNRPDLTVREIVKAIGIGVGTFLLLYRAGTQKLLQRALLWGNDQPFNFMLGRLSHRYNKPMEWKYTPGKKHCIHCETFNGVIMLGKDWRFFPAPKSRDLECHGYNCGCELLPTSEEPNASISSLSLRLETAVRSKALTSR